MPQKELERWVSLWRPRGGSPSFTPSGPSSGLPPVPAQGLGSTLGWAYLSTVPSRAPRTPWPTIRKKSYYFLTVLSRYIDHFLTVSTKLTVNQNFSKGFLLATI